MRYSTITVWISLSALAVILASAGISEADHARTPGSPVEHAQTIKEAVASDMPVYRPPKNSVPGARLGGGKRGVGDDLLLLAALVPNHTGLTVKEQPVLHFYISNTTSAPIEFSLIEQHSLFPVVLKRLPAPSQPGVQQIRLADFGVKLKLGAKYEWTVTLILDPNKRLRDIVAGGVIQRVPLPEELSERLAHTDKDKIPHLYADAGIWYDAITAIWELIEANPNDPSFRKQRASLLKQVGLPDVAKYDISL